MKILIVEDNKILSDNIKSFLELEGEDIKQLFEAKGVIFELIQSDYDLVIMDIGLGDGNGVELCYEIRKRQNNIPILILSANSKIKDKISGLEGGADDYMTKPFDYDELYARIKTLVRRNDSIKTDNIVIGDVELYGDEKKVTRKGECIEISKTEFKLLLFLCHNRGKVMEKETLLKKVWGEFDPFGHTRTLDVHVGMLRKKLGAKFIETKRGVGYIIN